jgi:predicted nucleotide-binding protein
LNRALLLAEIEDVIRTMPPRETISHETQENLGWFGRVSAVIAQWDPSKVTLMREQLALFFSNRHARERGFGLTRLIALLNEAHAELRMERAGMSRTASNRGTKVFVGHGRSLVWHQLKSFLSDRLHLQCDEFNAEAAAGLTTTDRLREMLDSACFAFLVMTAEDIHSDNSSHARENVIHEAGLFQGRLGFNRAIILLEEGCALFSNIHGLTHISFPKGNLEPAFEKIRLVLEREKVGHDAPLVPASTHDAEGPEGERCPKCLRNGWRIESNKLDPLFGALGVTQRLYRCHFCGFSEPKLVD